MDIIRANTVEDIYGTLKYFEGDMPRLASKVGDYFSYAQKLNRDAYVYVVKENSESLGFISFYANNTVQYIGFISLLVVSQRMRRKGIGSLLVNCSFEKMKESGMETARLEVEQSNAKAIAFYQYMGFETSGANCSSGFYMQRKL